MVLICPICSENNLEYTSNHLDWENIKIYYCQSCNYWFTNPEPTEIELNQHYQSIYSEKRDNYFGDVYYDIMEKRAKAQIKFIKTYIEQNNHLSQWKAIDIGCGIGALVSSLEKETAFAIGYDSDRTAIKIGKSLWNSNIYQNDSDISQKYNQDFDLLCMSHVVEHLPNIKQSLHNILSILKPNGYIFIEVPNCFPEMFSNKVDTESHLHFFTQNSLIKLLDCLNLEVITCQSCGIPKFQGYNQVNSKKQNIFNQLLSRLKIKNILKKIFKIINRKNDNSSLNVKIKTIYDGFYDLYYPVETPDGIWLRCLARKK